MRLSTSYRQIFSISAPIMLGSAVQNLIALTDSLFLYYLDETDFATIGFVGVFYLVVASIGYGFSKGGQIIISRRMGEHRYPQVGRTFYDMVYFELGLALVMFLFMQYGCPYFFKLFVESPEIYAKSLEYLEYRSWGVFFSYTGVAMIALYTGTARPGFIVTDTLLLAVVNGVLNYALIFGHFGLPAMGIAGAGLASTLAEAAAFVAFVGYILLDRKNRAWHLFRLPPISWVKIRNLYSISTPIVAQSIVGLGSWFVFFGVVENMGERPLAITNLIRMVYLVLSIPTWGFASGVNTLVSNFIGAQKRQAVLPLIWKTAKLCWLVTMVFTLPVALFPEVILAPLLHSGGDIILNAKPLFHLLILMLTGFSIGGIYFNGLSGTGATYSGLKVQTICAVMYLVYVHLAVNVFHANLLWAWGSEVFYWALMLGCTLWYLHSRRWHGVRV